MFAGGIFFFREGNSYLVALSPSVADKSVFTAILISVLAELTFAQRCTSEWSLLFCHSRHPLAIQSGSVENVVFPLQELSVVVSDFWFLPDFEFFEAHFGHERLRERMCSAPQRERSHREPAEEVAVCLLNQQSDK